MSEKNWFWQTDEGKKVERATWSDLVAAIKRGEVDAETNLSNDGQNWRLAGTYPETAEALAEKARRDEETGERSTVEKETREEKADWGDKEEKGEWEEKEKRGCGRVFRRALAVVLVLLALTAIQSAIRLASDAGSGATRYMKCLDNMKQIGACDAQFHRNQRRGAAGLHG